MFVLCISEKQILTINLFVYVFGESCSEMGDTRLETCF